MPVEIHRFLLMDDELTLKHIFAEQMSFFLKCGFVIYERIKRRKKHWNSLITFQYQNYLFSKERKSLIDYQASKFFHLQYGA